MTVTELERAVAQLTEEELARFRAWFEEFEFVFLCALCVWTVFAVESDFRSLLREDLTPL